MCVYVVLLLNIYLGIEFDLFEKLYNINVMNILVGGHLMLKSKYYVRNCMTSTKYMLYIGILVILFYIKKGEFLYYHSSFVFL